MSSNPLHHFIPTDILLLAFMTVTKCVCNVEFEESYEATSIENIISLKFPYQYHLSNFYYISYPYHISMAERNKVVSRRSYSHYTARYNVLLSAHRDMTLFHSVVDRVSRRYIPHYYVFV